MTVAQANLIINAARLHADSLWIQSKDQRFSVSFREDVEVQAITLTSAIHAYEDDVKESSISLPNITSLA